MIIVKVARFIDAPFRELLFGMGTGGAHSFCGNERSQQMLSLKLDVCKFLDTNVATPEPAIMTVLNVDRQAPKGARA